jgi:hypothetical protein
LMRAPDIGAQLLALQWLSLNAGPF